MRLIGLTTICLLLSVSVRAQAPAPTLKAALEHATKQRQAAEAEALATDAGKRFLAWQAQEKALAALVKAEADKAAATEPKDTK